MLASRSASFKSTFTSGTKSCAGDNKEYACMCLANSSSACKRACLAEYKAARFIYYVAAVNSGGHAQ